MGSGSFKEFFGRLFMPTNVKRGIDVVVPDTTENGVGDAELTRIANENVRVTQESGRVTAEAGRQQKVQEWQAQVDALVLNGGGDVYKALANTFGAVNTFSAGLRSGEVIAAGSNDTTVSTTAWVTAKLGIYATAASVDAKAPLASPEFTGVPTVPTPLQTDNTTTIVNSSWVRTYVANNAPSGSSVTQEQVEDWVAAMFTAGVTHSGATVGYDDTNGKLQITNTTSGSTATGNAVKLVPAPVADPATNVTNIQNVINNSVNGDTIQFQAGTYNINAAIELRGGRQYRGHGSPYGIGDSTTIRQANAANIVTGTAGFTGLFVFTNWNHNTKNGTATTQNVNGPVRITNLHFDGNRANNPTGQVCGLVLWTYWSIVDHCGFSNANIDGIRATDTDSSGRALGNSASENQILFCRFDENGQAHFRQHQGQTSGTNNWNLDGRLFYNYMDTNFGDWAIRIDRAAGWYVEGNHIYGILRSAILVNNAFATTVTNNYVEPFGRDGNSTTSTLTYYGIKSDILGGRGLICSHNIVGAEAVSDTATYRIFDLQGNSTSTMASILGNQMYGSGAFTNRITGLRLVLGGGTGYQGRYVAQNLHYGFPDAQKNSISTGWTKVTD